MHELDMVSGLDIFDLWSDVNISVHFIREEQSDAVLMYRLCLPDEVNWEVYEMSDYKIKNIVILTRKPYLILINIQFVIWN